MFKNIFQWIWYSSKDPSKVSLTVKMAGIAIIPWILKGIGLSCMFGMVCIQTDAAELTKIAEEIASIVLLLLTVVGHLGVIYAFLRKIYISVVH